MSPETLLYHPVIKKIGRLLPLVGIVANRLVYPGLHCGLGVELPAKGLLHVGKSVRIGGLSRFYVAEGGLVNLGSNVNLGRDVHVQTDGHSVSIGAYSGIQDHCRLYGAVSIGQGCLFAPNVYVSSGTHFFDKIPYLPIQIQERSCEAFCEPVEIGDDCWIGINAVIRSGITVGRGCVIGANSVVVDDVPPYSVVAGSPAKLIRRRLEFLPPDHVDASNKVDWPYFYSGFDQISDGDSLVDSLESGCKFVLAIEKPNALAIKLVIAAVDGVVDISWNDQTHQVSSDFQQICFSIPRGCMLNGYLEFSASAGCRVRSASLC